MSPAAAILGAFERKLSELGLTDDDAEIEDPVLFGERAALIGAAEALWRRRLTLLGTADVQKMLDVSSRQAVSDQVKRLQLLAVPTGGGRLAYPAFQFSATGRPFPSIRDVLRAFAPADLTPHTVASWFVTAQDALDGKTPAEWMADSGDVETLKEAARRSAAKLSA